MSPQAVQGDYISDLPAVVTPAVELAGGLLEVEVLTGPVAGAYVNKRVTAEQLAEYLLTGRLALTAGLRLPNAQAQLAAGTPLRGGVQYGLIGDWNSTGDDTQVVFVHAADAQTFRTNGTLVRFGLPSEEVVVDVVASTAIPRIAQHTAQLATLGAQAAPVMAYLADNSVAPFQALDEALAFPPAGTAQPAKKKVYMEFHTAVLEVLTSGGGWPSYTNCTGTVVYFGENVQLELRGKTNANLTIEAARFYQKATTFGAQINLVSTAAQTAPPATLPSLDGDYAIPIQLTGLIQARGTYASIVGTGTVYAVEPFYAGNVSAGVTVVRTSSTPAPAPTAEVYTDVAFTPNISLDMAATAQLLSLPNNVGFLPATNKAKGRQVRVFLFNTASTAVTLGFPSDWTFIGPRPGVLAAGKQAVLTLESPRGAAETDILAGYASEL
jgi:hypothetical protein